MASDRFYTLNYDEPLSKKIVRDFYFSTPELDEFITTHGLALDDDWRIYTEAALSN